MVRARRLAADGAAAAAACAALLALGLPGARAELPEPTPLPAGSVAPVHAPISPVHEALAPVRAPIAPVHGAQGRWIQEEVSGNRRITLSGEVHFDKREATLTPTAVGLLDELTASWGAAPPQRVTVIGHTDTDGEAVGNQDLSERRAQAVAEHLAAAHPDVGFVVSGKGESEPLSDETVGGPQERAEAKERNRRVVLSVEQG